MFKNMFNYFLRRGIHTKDMESSSARCLEHQPTTMVCTYKKQVFRVGETLVFIIPSCIYTTFKVKTC